MSPKSIASDAIRTALGVGLGMALAWLPPSSPTSGDRMPPLEIELAEVVGGAPGAEASIIGPGGDLDRAYISLGWDRGISGKAACLSAAEILEETARQFRRLAKKEDPFDITIQERINRIAKRHETSPDAP